MSVAQPLGLSGGSLDSYRRSAADAGDFDELLGRPGQERPEQAFLAAAIESLGTGGLLAARAEARRLADDDGIRYGIPDLDEPPRFGAQSWTVDPLPLVIGAAEWSALESGLRQRVRLLDALLDDFYGERHLIRRGLIPPEVVLGHPGFIRQVDGIRGQGTRLTLGACDVGRDTSGTWRALTDRTSAPSGAGYAMANRRIVSRVLAGVHRGTELARLRGFFHTLTAAVRDAAVTTVENPRAVLLSPGPLSETAYDQSFLASLIGFPLVEADDLTLRDGRVWIRASGRLEPVDVMLRRIDPEYCDPLELRADSQLGLPGLVEATRRGTVAVANPIGAAVLENRALAPFLPGVARAILGEELLLASAPTWWCGGAKECAYVLAHLDDLVLRRTASRADEVHRGHLLSAAQKADLIARIEREPWAWVGYEPLPLSTAPVVTSSGVQAGRVVLRTFWHDHEDGAIVMPGGLGRVNRDPASTVVSSAAGAYAKDVWVLAEAKPDPRWADWGAQPTLFPPPRTTEAVAPRVADNLFWIGRYAARAESTARLLRVANDLAEDHALRIDTPGQVAMKTILDAAARIAQIPAPDGESPHDHVRAILGASHRTGSVAFSANRLVESARRVRDILSGDIWHVLGRLERTLAPAPESAHVQTTLLNVLESLLAVSGIIGESMVRDESWGFLDGGQRIERAQTTVRLLGLCLAVDRPPIMDGQVTEAVLEVGESIITHRRRTVASVGPAWPTHSALSLLLCDIGNPRSVTFQVSRLAEDFQLIGDHALADRMAALLAEIAGLDLGELTSGDRSTLAATTDRIDQALRAASDDLAQRHFARKPAQMILPVAWSGAQS